jgi:hypothetical protein
MTDSSVPLPRQGPSVPGAPARQAAREASTAAQKVAERVLLLDRPRYVDAAPPYLDPDHGGLVLCGQNAGGRARGGIVKSCGSPVRMITRRPR